MSLENSLLKQYSFSELLDRFEQIHIPTIRQSTATRYLIDIKLRIRPYFEFYKVNRITIAHIEDFRSSIRRDLSVKSTNNCIALLKTLFRKAITWGMISQNPARDVALLKVPQQRYIWWDNEEDIKIFLRTARETRYYLAYRLALDLGMRLGEIIGLSKADINLERHQIHIHRQWLDKEQRYGPTKQNRERFIGYDPGSDLHNLLRQAVQNSPHPEAIITALSGKRLGARKLSGYHFKRAIIKSGVPDIRFHDLRHTFASWFMIKNDDIWALKGILGHNDIQTTQKYAHLSSRFQNAPVFDWNLKEEVCF